MLDDLDNLDRMMWYEKYGWNENPFLIKYNTNLVGLENEKQKLKDFVVSGNICFVVGDSGVGKTSLLKWLQRNLKSFKINYINAEALPEFFSLKKQIKKGWFKPTLLMLDEAQLCDEIVRSEIKVLYDTGVVKSVVIAQTNEKLNDYNVSFKSRVGKRFVRLEKLTLQDVIDLINIRTKNKHPFTNEMIKCIAEDADYNPRKVLENCEYICIELQNSQAQFNDEIVKKILKKKAEEDLFDLVKLEEPVLPDNLMPIDDAKLDGFSPMQKRIITILLEGNRTAKQLAIILNSTEGSVGKQLSKLAELNAVTIVNHRRPKVYGLKKEFKSTLN
ncbi:hypothetical protein D6777_02635 [Candidatus Woesearchaeota archaeon]|nr:MAG: hypothetical protein D6777_02635 [Candidatus Woesearchaeota archaeon]